MRTTRIVIKHSTYLVAIVAIVSLLIILWYFFSHQPVSYAGSNDMLSGVTASKQSDKDWKDVAKKASEAIAQGKNEEAIALLSAFKSQLLSTRVSSEMTATHLNRVLGFERLIEKIKTHTQAEEIQEVLRALMNHF